MFDYVVVGKGLIGSAAFRYLAEQSPNTLLIGPDEPADPTTHDGVFGAHYDEGRLTHLHGKSPVWGELCRRSIAGYRTLEAQSGIPFYQPVGELFVTDPEVDATYHDAENLRHSREVLGADLEVLDAAACRAQFPFLSFREESQVLWEREPAGYLNPRAMIRAQVAVGEAAGGQTQADIVIGTENYGDHMVVMARSGKRYKTRRLLVATGAFANSYAQLPHKLDLRLKTEHVIYARLSASECHRLSKLPVIHYDLSSPDLADLYLVPPIPYPDGHHYLKMGANTSRDQFLTTLPELQAWYRQGDSDAVKTSLQSTLLALFPDLKVESWHTGRCIITRTPHKMPMIDTISDGRLYVAVGGNGSSAACAAGLGELAANLVIHNGWQDALPAERFAARFQTA